MTQREEKRVASTLFSLSLSISLLLMFSLGLSGLGLRGLGLQSLLMSPCLEGVHVHIQLDESGSRQENISTYSGSSKK